MLQARVTPKRLFPVILRCVLSLQVTLDSGEEYQAKVRKQGGVACEDAGFCGTLRQLFALAALPPSQSPGLHVGCTTILPASPTPAAAHILLQRHCAAVADVSLGAARLLPLASPHPRWLALTRTRT